MARFLHDIIFRNNSHDFSSLEKDLSTILLSAKAMLAPLQFASKKIVRALMPSHSSREQCYTSHAARNSNPLQGGLLVASMAT